MAPKPEPQRPDEQRVRSTAAERDERVKIPLPFEDAVRQLLKTPPPREAQRPDRK